MLAVPAPVLQPPIAPLVVRRGYRAAAPYRAGGRRSVRLAARAGDRVVAPCGGRAAFVGGVAGGRPVVTVLCAGSGLRVTVAGVAASVGAGAEIGAGASVGRALAGHVGLSVRRPGDGYVDPLSLLRRASVPPPGVGLVPRLARRSPPRLPEVRLDRAVRALGRIHGSHHWAHGDRSDAPDRVVGTVGVIAGLLALLWLLLPAARRRLGSEGRVVVHRVALRR